MGICFTKDPDDGAPKRQKSRKRVDSYASPGARTPGGRRSRYRSDAREAGGDLPRSRVGSYGSLLESEGGWGGKSPTDRWLEEHEEVQAIFRHTTTSFIDVSGRTPQLDAHDLDERIRAYREAVPASKSASWDGHPTTRLPAAPAGAAAAAAGVAAAARAARGGGRAAEARRDALAVADALLAIRPAGVGVLVVPVGEL